MATRFSLIHRLRTLVAAGAVVGPGLAAAHGTDHLHFWGSHSADGQFGALFVGLGAVAAISWWVWRSGR